MPELGAVTVREQDRSGTPEPAARAARLREYLRAQVRTGVHAVATLHRLAGEASAAEIDGSPAAQEAAEEIVSQELQAWRREAAGWIGRTDPDRLDAALARLVADGVRVLAAVADDEALDEQWAVPTGAPDARSDAVAYTVPAIWAALDTNRLPLLVRDARGRPVPHRSDLISQVIDALADEGLLASAPPGDGVVMVSLHWRRRPRG